jgi:hypothetical protein
MRCERCGGLKLDEQFYGMDESMGVWSYAGLRCVNCGGIWFAEAPEPAGRGPSRLAVEER